VVVLDRMYSECMKLALFGKDIESVTPDIERLGFEVVSSEPDMVITFGGDGTLLKSEAAFPGIPKVLIKRSPTCRLCVELPLDDVLSRIKWGDYSVHEIPKLEIRIENKKWRALNDVVIRNANPRHAIRFDVRVGRHIRRGIIGDGVVIATSLGSTGYFHSITGETFNSGVGVAFNNPASGKMEPIVTSEKDFSLSLDITRGPALAYADNQDDEVVLSDGESIEVGISNEYAQVLTFGT